MERTYSEQEKVRRQALSQLEALGIDPYPADEYSVNTTTKSIKEGYTPETQRQYQEVSLAGRIMSRRVMGKASFVELQDKDGRIQLYFKRDDICPGEDKTMYNVVFKKLLDIGDIIGVKGYVFKTQMGETTVYVQSFRVLAKSLRPLPVIKEKDGKVYDAFTDSQQRYRQRYLDLIVNPQIRDTFARRTIMVNTMRSFLSNKGYLEVETPVLQPIYGGAAARPFKTHHNTLNMTLYLRIANELYLKRLIVGGYEGVFEFAKDFRNEGMSRFHNPEFTQVELYVAYKDYQWMMELVEEMLEKVAVELHGTTKVKVGENIIDFKRPWKRYTMFESIREYTGVDISNMGEKELRKTAEKLNVEVDASMGKGKLIDELFGETVESHLIQPTFITDYPVEMSPLAKKHRDNEELTERFEAICNGKEICNAFSELNDPVDQRNRLEKQLELGQRGDDEAMVLDEDFLRALEYGMPPTAGLGIGIDRLAMIMTNAKSIQDVIFFPQMKAEEKPQTDSDKEFEDAGVPTQWVPLVREAGINTLEQLKMQNSNKLHNTLCGLKKKKKLDLKNPTPQEVSQWME